MFDPRIIFSIFFGLSLIKKLLITLILLIILGFIIYKYSCIDFKSLLDSYKTVKLSFESFILKIKGLLKI